MPRIAAEPPSRDKNMSENRATPMGTIVAARLRALRRRRGWSQADLADEAVRLGARDIDRSVISKVESEARRVTVEELLQFAAALNVSPVNLLIPERGETLVAITDALIVTAQQLQRWIVGNGPLPDASEQQYFTEVPIDHWAGANNVYVRLVGAAFRDILDTVDAYHDTDQREDAADTYDHLAGDITRAIQRARRALDSLPPLHG